MSDFELMNILGATNDIISNRANKDYIGQKFKKQRSNPTKMIGAETV